MQKFFTHFQPHFYYIDSIDTETHLSTRLLLTSFDYDDCLEEVDLKEEGSPLKRGRWRYAESCVDDDGQIIDHELEIAIEVDAEDCKWLYDNCYIGVNNHGLANKTKRGYFQNHICHKFNNFGVPCDFALGVAKARKCVADWYPDLFD